MSLWGSHKHKHHGHHHGHSPKAHSPGHQSQSPVKLQVNTQLFFDPNPDVLYKVVSVLDGNKCFTINQGGNHNLLLDDFKGTDNQTFHVYQQNGKYALVSVFGNAALHIAGDTNQEGAPLLANPAKFPSNWFEVLPVTNGSWAGKACYFKTLGVKAVDIKGGLPVAGAQIVQWSHHGGNNQTWVITPAQPNQQGQQGQQGQQIPQQLHAGFPQVAPLFVSAVNQLYRVVSAVDPNKSLTVKTTANNKLTIEDYVGDATQKFHIYQQNGKSAFVVSSSNTGLCIYLDKHEDGGQVVSDPGKHASSWFEVVPVKAGEWASKAYVIKTFAGKALDVSGGVAKNGAPVVQWTPHGQNNQSWLILAAEQPLPQGTTQGLGLGQLNTGGLFGQGSGFNWQNIALNPNLITSQGTNSGFNQPQQSLFKPNQHYAFVTVANPNKVIDVSGNPAHKGELILYDWHGQYNQKFTFEPFQQGKYRIKSVASGLFVHITNDSQQDNVWIRTDPIGTKTDVWQVIPATQFQGKNAYHLKSVYGKTIGIQGGVANEVNLIHTSYNGSESQTWIIKQV